eukprot:TRINITY_DN71080_c0_g1_i1.p1 TRINITY_DN71080_c0_g1~~TRINITY_DN71080_c0_g1_i1.p1  ORF type:complete len:558 (+),score=111.41 TRINITY_DN71080_c0_g1_i1:212-1885(+)
MTADVACSVAVHQGAGDGIIAPADAVVKEPMCKPLPCVSLGLTKPLSFDGPTDTDFEQTKRMIRELDLEFPRETDEGMGHRDSVLQELEEIVTKWMTEMGVKEGKTPEEAQRCSLKIVTLGSYRLGVVQPSSDIDTLCIGPPYVTRESFFNGLVKTLEGHEAVTVCVPIPDAFTPVVKLQMRGVSVDMLFARLSRTIDRTTVDLGTVLLDDDILRDMDEKSIRSMNGYRVADRILKLVPDREAFRQTLRFIKYWARRRGIYSNVLGFFGGITWSLMVARVCQLYPNYVSSQLVERFFKVFSKWEWPKPVMLGEIEHPDGVSGVSGAKAWMPNLPGDRPQLMPVITPSFPAMNSTYNVTESTKRIMMEEFRRGRCLAKALKAGSLNGTVSSIHEPYPFFEAFNHFLWLEVLAKTEEVYLKFSGWVESKLRMLMKHLDPIKGIILHPSTEKYDLGAVDELQPVNGVRGKKSRKDWPMACGMFIALDFWNEYGASCGQRIDLRPALSSFVDVINHWVERDVYKGQYLLRLHKIKASDVPQYALNAEANKRLPLAMRSKWK